MSRSDRVSQFVHSPKRSSIALAAACLIILMGSGAYARAQSPQTFTPFEQDPATVDWSDQIPAHVAFVDGAAQLERDGRLEDAEENVPLLGGDRIVTSRGRVEILFADGSVLDLDQFSGVDFLSDSLLRLTSGRLRLSIVRMDGSLNYRVDAAGTSTWIRASGDYRISMPDARAVEPEVRVTVLRGSAELTSPFGRTLIRTGAEARTTARSEPSLPYAMSTASWDEFDRWADDRHNDRVGTTSAQYLPAELRAYGGTFDQNGSWQYEPPFGYVWYPRVAVGWQPYYDGGWSFVGSFGWTWVGGGRWGWPTHHYGRWGVSSDRWYWIPDRHWAPAWVSWGYAPGYVSWCPLGYDNRPVVAINTVNVYNSRSRWGWTAAPARSFSASAAVSRRAVSVQPLSASLLSASPANRFVARSSGPARPAMARTDAQPLRGPSPVSARASTSMAPRSFSSVEVVPRARAASSVGVDPRVGLVMPSGGDRLRSALNSDPSPHSTSRVAGSRSQPASAPVDRELPSARSAPRRVASRPSAPEPTPSTPSADWRGYDRRAPGSAPAPAADADRPREAPSSRARSAPQPSSPPPSQSGGRVEPGRPAGPSSSPPASEPPARRAQPRGR